MQTRSMARLNAAHEAHLKALEAQRTELISAHATQLEHIREESRAIAERNQARLANELESTRNKYEQSQNNVYT